jgi:hypothetical protein
MMLNKGVVDAMKSMLLTAVFLAGAAAGSVWAQNPGNNGDQNPTQDAVAQAAAQLKEEPESKVVSVYMLGTVEVRGHGNVFIDVKSARETNGAGLHELVAKSLQVTGKCLRQLEQLHHKTVELRGEVKKGRDFEVFSFTERRTPSAAESAKTQGAHGPVGSPIGAINTPGPSERISASGNRTPIEALNDPKGAGANKPNRGALGTLQGRRKPVEVELRPDEGLPVVAAVGAVR